MSVSFLPLTPALSRKGRGGTARRRFAEIDVGRSVEPLTPALSRKGRVGTARRRFAEIDVLVWV